MTRVGDLHDDRVNHRQVEAGGHSIIQERRIGHLTVVIVNILFIECPTDALGDTALQLSFDVARMDGLPDILECRVPEDIDFAGFRVHFHVYDVNSERITNA